jgi:hypothetical protein
MVRTAYLNITANFFAVITAICSHKTLALPEEKTHAKMDILHTLYFLLDYSGTEYIKAGNRIQKPAV